MSPQGGLAHQRPSLTIRGLGFLRLALRYATTATAVGAASELLAVGALPLTNGGSGLGVRAGIRTCLCWMQHHRGKCDRRY